MTQTSRQTSIYRRAEIGYPFIGAGRQSIIIYPHIASTEVVHGYDRLTRTIYLPDQWKGDTPSELSILVHEVAHHLQYQAIHQYSVDVAAPSPASYTSAPVSREIPSASGQRIQSPSRMTLTPDELLIAKASGISATEYARNKIRLAKEKASGERQ